MANDIFLPKKVAVHDPKSPGGEDFWNDFWSEFSDKESYGSKINKLKDDINRILTIPKDQTKENENKNIRVKLELHKKAIAKSNKPSQIWDNSHIEIIESSDDFTFTLSGKYEDFKKLQSLIGNADFDKAKIGLGIPRNLKNIYREAYAVQSLEPKEKELKSRLSRDLLADIENADDDKEYDLIIDLYSDEKRSSYDLHYNQLEKSVNAINKVDLETVVTNLLYCAKASKLQIINLLTDPDFNFISKIKKQPKYEAERCLPNITVTQIVLEKEETDQIVGIIDSGISHPLINKLKYTSENKIRDASYYDPVHGTFVASRILFGDDMAQKFLKNSIAPVSKFIDITVLEKGDGKPICIPYDLLANAITSATKKYADKVTVYNISINEDKGIKPKDDISNFTELLDTLSRNHDILFVCSTGNHTNYQVSDYENIFNDPSLDTNIASPADGLNILTVGSVVGKVGVDAFCNYDGFPSPFSRKSTHEKYRKPEVVSNGGNIDINYESHKYGADGLTDTGLQKMVGTSFSTPLVTRQCVYILNYLKNNRTSPLYINQKI